MSLGFGELAILAVIVLLFFGAGKIPKLMGDMAGGIQAFKKGMRDEMAEQGPKAAADPAAAAGATAAQTAQAAAAASTAAPSSPQAPIIDVKAEMVPPSPPRV
jgi:sec-independent protein translocase protein TatA